MEGKTLDEMFRASVRKYPESTLTGKEKSRGEENSESEKAEFSRIAEKVSRIAKSLKDRGIGKGDRVAIMGKPRPEWAISFFALQRLGAIAVPVASDLTSQEIRRILHESEAKLAVVESKYQSKVTDNFDLLPLLEDVVVYSGQPPEGYTAWKSLMGEEKLTREPELEQDDLAAIMYTSGSTGNAKGVMLSHENFISNVDDLYGLLELSQEDVFASILPWYHIYGLTTSLLLAVYAGASVVYTDDYRNLTDVLKEEEATILLGVPKLYHTLYKELEHKVNSSLVGRLLHRYVPFLLRRKVKKKFAGDQFRFVVSGGAPLDPQVSRGLKRLGIGVMQGYGLTETSPVLTWTPDPFSEKDSSVGQSLPSVEVKLSGSGENDIPEVLVKGPMVMKGYYKNQEKTDEVIDEDGWFHTGDPGWFGGDGELYLNARKKNVIILESGKNVYPEEVEWELNRLPYVEEVLVKENKRRGRPVVAASIYPDYDALEEKGLTEKVEIKDYLWGIIRDNCKDLAVYKRIKSKKDIRIKEEPFAKTPTMKVKRYLYEDEKVAES